jgi:hypothetical protein
MIAYVDSSVLLRVALGRYPVMATHDKALALAAQVARPQSYRNLVNPDSPYSHFQR